MSMYSISSPCITVTFLDFFPTFCYVTSSLFLAAVVSCLQHMYEHFLIHSGIGLGACSVSKETLTCSIMLSVFVLILHVFFFSSGNALDLMVWIDADPH